MSLGLFLQTLAADSLGGSGSLGAFGALLGFLAAFALIAVALLLAVYVYTSLAFMALSKRTGNGSGALSWIPLIGKPLVASKIAKMHWWPVLLGVVGYLLTFIGGGLGISSLVFVSYVFFLAFGVYWIIWSWKVFEAVGRPGWWIIFIFLPGVGGLIYLILLGIAAWGSGGTRMSPQNAVMQQQAQQAAPQQVQPFNSQ